MNSDKCSVRLDPGLEILADRLAKITTSCVLATVISAIGSTYRKPGARMLIESDGRITGLLSGGCLEQDLREHANSILAAGEARTVTYDMRADNDLVFGIGAGCEGGMTILLEPVERGSRAALAIARAGELSERGELTALVMFYQGPAGRRGTHLWHASVEAFVGEPLANVCQQAVATARPQDFRGSDDSGPCAAWIQPVLPLPAILICGAGSDVQPLAAAFQALHYPVTVADHRPAFANADDFPGATVLLGPSGTLASRIDLTRFFAAVVMSHNLASDADYLGALARSSLPYIGVLGPRVRRSRLLAELGEAGGSIAARLRGPIGLDIGAVTPEGIALAIAAEVHAAAARQGERSCRPE
jgi:xanthine dehydrogenase accessory factor